MKLKLPISFFLLVFLFVPLCGKDNPMPKIRFMPQWLPQCQFAGFYVAKQLGIYEKNGLDVEIINGGPDKPAPEMLKSGKVDFVTLFLSSGIKEKAEGMNIIDIAQFSKKSALVYITKKKSGILMPGDMQGKRLGLWKSDFQDIPLAFIEKYDLNLEIVPITSTVNLFLRDGVDIMTVMWYNEYHSVLNCGLNEDELQPFFFYDYDLNIPEDGVYCLVDTYKNNPEICDKFIKSSLEGWNYAFKNKEKAVQIILKVMNEAHLPANRAHQQWMLDRMEDLFYPDREKDFILNTELKEDDYRKTAEILFRCGSIDKIPDFKDFFIDCGKNVKK